MNETDVIEKIQKCPNCNKVISGRIDKVFCDDRCRNNYYYKINSERKTFIRNVNKTLLKNRGILRTLNPHGRTTVDRNNLEELGFDFNCFTGIHKTRKGKLYYLVYDQAFSLDDNDKVTLLVFYKDAEPVEG